MCGVAAVVGARAGTQVLTHMLDVQRHRGPDARGLYLDPSAHVGLGHVRLSIIDLSPAGTQPMHSSDGRFHLVYNGEVYNYRALRRELGSYPFRGESDSEVVLAAYARWGERCLERFVGMFAFVIWDAQERRLVAARDRFGVKPLYYACMPDGSLVLASEIQALHAAGVVAQPDVVAWATYLTRGAHDVDGRTFWQGVRAVPAGHLLRWQSGQLACARWYDPVPAVLAEDTRPAADVLEEYGALARESIRLRLQADVPVGVNLSGGLDSSILLALVREARATAAPATAFTFVTGDPDYDELPWVRRMLDGTPHELVVCSLSATEVPALAAAAYESQQEPYGGLPTLAYASLFQRAREHGILVLLDGQGLDEQWAGYDYFAHAERGEAPIVQGTAGSPVRTACLLEEFAAMAEPTLSEAPFPDALRNLQYRDIRRTKLPRALRFNDRVSMGASTELREPFLDHRLVELAWRQPAAHKVVRGQGKWLLRRFGEQVLPADAAFAPKRPLQTPQREWLRGPLRGWATDCIEAALRGYGDSWLDAAAVRREWQAYLAGAADTSYFVWQWIMLGHLVDHGTAREPRRAWSAAHWPAAAVTVQYAAREG